MSARHEPGSDVSTEVHESEDEREDGADVDTDAGLDQDVGNTPLSPRLQSTTRQGLLLVGVLVLGLVIGRVTAPDTEATEDTAPAEDQGLPFPTGDVDRTNYWGLAGLVPTASDTFDRPDGDLGQTETDQEWDVLSGQWVVADDTATLLESAASGPNLAVVADGTGPGLTEVTLSAVARGTGMVFRHLDAENHWTVTARPAAGTWTVHRVLDGQDQVVGEFEGNVADGVTVTVIQNQEVLRFLIDGEDQFILTDSELSEQRQGGLVAPPGFEGGTRWDRFLLMGFGADG